MALLFCPIIITNGLQGTSEYLFYKIPGSNPRTRHFKLKHDSVLDRLAPNKIITLSVSQFTFVWMECWAGTVLFHQINHNFHVRNALPGT